MIFGEVMDRFVNESGISVMFRGTLEHSFTPQVLDDMFATTAERQHCGELLFSSVVNLLGLVAVGIRDSVNEAYLAKKEQFTVSVQSVYNKLKGIETQVSRQMVRQTAARMAAVVKALDRRREPLLRGYQVKILDGNHLPATEHRLEELRYLRSGPLPGLALVVLEPDRMLMTDVFPCEDAYAQERSLLPEVLASVAAGDLWLGDRNICTTRFAFGVAKKQARFILRQHATTLHYELLGKRQKIGTCSSGVLYEQKMRLTDEEGRHLTVRRITVKLKKATRDGETEIHLLTNLRKKDANARHVANLYLKRWTIENAFQELAQALRSEINTLGYPKAALFSFCVAVLAYNAVSVVKSGLESVHGEQAKRENLSGYYLAGELAAAYHGMMIAIPPEEWNGRFGNLSAAQLAEALKTIAARVRPDRFRKNVRGPKKPRPKRSSGKRHHHVSTARILAQRKPSKALVTKT